MIPSVTNKYVNQNKTMENQLQGLTDIPWAAIAGPLVQAEDALARLDERLRTSPVREGWIARSHFRDVVACAWVSGELVSLEDLVLRDAGMDVRAATTALTQSQDVLRLRRKIAGAGGSILSAQAIELLRGRSAATAETTSALPAPLEHGDRFSMMFAHVDAAVGKAQHTLDQIAPAGAGVRDPLVYDLDWNETERMTEWCATLEGSRTVPPVLASAFASVSWQAVEPLQHQRWLGRILSAQLLRERGKVRTHLPCPYAGLRATGRGAHQFATVQDALLAEIGVITATAREGLRDHDRLMLARVQLQQKLKGRRISSRLPDLIELVLETPLISTGVVAKKLKVSQRSALDLIAELDLREFTGRGRYRAWGIM